jgi:hypothetical protein
MAQASARHEGSSTICGAPEWDAVDYLLGTVADLIEDDNMDLTTDLLIEGARCARASSGTSRPRIHRLGTHQAELQLALVYLRLYWCDDAFIQDIVDRFKGHAAFVQARLFRIAAVAMRQQHRTASSRLLQPSLRIGTRNLWRDD